MGKMVLSSQERTTKDEIGRSTPKKSRWTAPPRDPLLELKWGLALLGEQGRRDYLAWLNKNMKHCGQAIRPEPPIRAARRDA